MSEYRQRTETAKEVIRLIKEGQNFESQSRWHEVQSSECTEKARDNYNEAYKLLVLEFTHALHQQCLTIVGGTDASDIVEKALDAALKGMPQFRGIKGVQSLWVWLSTIAYRLCLNEFNRRRHMDQHRRQIQRKERERVAAVFRKTYGLSGLLRRSRSRYYERWPDAEAFRQDVAKLKDEDDKIILMTIPSPITKS